MRSTRRHTLKVIGSSVAVGLSGLASGEKTERRTKSSAEVFKQSLKIHEKTNSPEKAEEFLLNRGFAADKRKAKVQVPAGEDNVSTEQFEKESLEILIALYSPSCYDDSAAHRAKISWTYDADVGDCVSGTPGYDPVGITYKEGAWYVPNGTDAALSSDGVSIKAEDYETNGLKFRFDDYGEIDNPCWTQPWWYCAAPLKEADEDFNDGARQVWGVYAHQTPKWTGNLNVNFGGIGYSGWNDPIVWEVNEDQNGNDLLVNPNDAINC